MLLVQHYQQKLLGFDIKREGTEILGRWGRAILGQYLVVSPRLHMRILRGNRNIRPLFCHFKKQKEMHQGDFTLDYK